MAAAVPGILPTTPTRERRGVAASCPPKRLFRTPERRPRASPQTQVRHRQKLEELRKLQRQNSYFRRELERAKHDEPSKEAVLRAQKLRASIEIWQRQKHEPLSIEALEVCAVPSADDPSQHPLIEAPKYAEEIEGLRRQMDKYARELQEMRAACDKQLDAMREQLQQATAARDEAYAALRNRPQETPPPPVSSSSTTKPSSSSLSGAIGTFGLLGLCAFFIWVSTIPLDIVRLTN